MDLLGDIMSAMDKNQKPSLSKADKNLQSKLKSKLLDLLKMPGISFVFIYISSSLLEQYQEQQKVAEKERQIINNYKVKIQNKLAAFLKDDKLATMQFDPMEKVFRSVIIETTEESNSSLHCHTFGKEDRYVIVYKNPPSELEIEARRYGDYKKWSKEIEAEYKKKKEEDLAFAASLTIPTGEEGSSGSAESRESKPTKKQKLVHLECEALGTDLNRNYGMVSTELKKDTRSIEQTLNDIQEKKRLKTQHQAEQN